MTSEGVSDRELEDDFDLQPGPSKRCKPSSSGGGSTRKLNGAARYKTKFQHVWQDKWPFATPVLGDPHSFLCNVCNKLVSCGHQGERDVSRHYESTQHQKSVAAVANTRKLNFKPSRSVQLQKEQVSVARSKILHYPHIYGVHH